MRIMIEKKTFLKYVPRFAEVCSLSLTKISYQIREMKLPNVANEGSFPFYRKFSQMLFGGRNLENKLSLLYI